MRRFKNRRFRKIDRRIQALSGREWWAMLIVGSVLLATASQQFMGRSIAAEQAGLTDRYSSANTQLAALQQAEQSPAKGAQVAAAATNDLSLDALVERQKQLQQQLHRSNGQLAYLADHVISASEMPTVLDQLLASTKQAKLQKLSNTGAVQIVAAPQAELLNKNLPEGIYQHSLELQLGGNFKQLNNTLSNLQSASAAWRITSLQYQVVDYPSAEMTLGIQVFVNAADWLGI